MDEDQQDIDDAAWDQKHRELERMETELIKAKFRQLSESDQRMKEWEKMWEPAFDRIFQP